MRWSAAHREPDASPPRNGQLAFAACTPSTSLSQLASDDRVFAIYGGPLHPPADNAQAAALSHVTPLFSAPYNLSGNGVVVSLFELAAADTTHREFGGRLTAHFTGGNSDDATHATHVSGTIIAAGIDPQAKGMAPAATLNEFSATTDTAVWMNDKQNTLPSLGVVADNNSWGFQLGWQEGVSGAPGGIAWYGADQAGNSNTLPLTTNWNVFVAESVNGHAVSPKFTLSQATDHVNHTGDISTGGLTGSSDRSLADFFQIGLDPAHRVNISYADNHAGTSVSYFTREKAAASGINTGGKCAGTTHEAGGTGHISSKKSGQASFSFNYDDSTQPTGSASFNDAGSGVNFQSTQVPAATFNSVAHTVTLAGSGTDNGRPVTYTIVAADSSLAAPGLFSITLSDGYSDSGNLLDGSITVY